MDLFPEVVQIRLLDEYTKKPLPKMAMRMKLYASSKNDYSLMLPLSGPDGIITIHKDWIETEIQQLQTQFLMDYSSKLEDCKPQIEFFVPDDESLKETIRIMETFRNTTRLVDPDTYRDAMNKSYLPIVVLIDLEVMSTMKIDITLKSRQ